MYHPGWKWSEYLNRWIKKDDPQASFLGARVATHPEAGPKYFRYEQSRNSSGAQHETSNCGEGYLPDVVHLPTQLHSVECESTTGDYVPAVWTC